MTGMHAALQHDKLRSSRSIQQDTKAEKKGEIMRKFWHGLEEHLNDYNIKTKLIIIYVFCMILPMVMTDSIILYILYDAGQKEQNYQAKNICDAIQYDLEYIFEDAANRMNNIYLDRAINNFLNEEYASPYEFFSAKTRLSGNSSLDLRSQNNISNVVICADNETIVNGGHFCRLSGVKNTAWYLAFENSGRNMCAVFYYIGEEDQSAMTKRRISLVRRLNYFRGGGCEKLVRVDIDYNKVARKLTSLDYGYGVYVCEGDRILFSNRGHSGSSEDFHLLTGEESVAFRSSLDLYGEPIDILILQQPSSVFSQLEKHKLLVGFLVCVNLLLPMVMVSMVNRSFTGRLRKLGSAFQEVREEGSLQEIEEVKGRDEIGSLMENYNRMVCRMNDLIQRVYKNRLEKQEIELARQNAELLALHSQINPHFLFNVLESIRMRCILHQENETAGMIEKLAVLERQNINWASDHVTLAEEIHFVKAYLELQRYRFGDRLRYEIELADECEDYLISKLTLTTFVENSCVHGMEQKAATCWIYVRVYHKGKWLFMEIEDTGGGMEERVVEEMNAHMRDCKIEDIKENAHVGIINACLRLKMLTKGNVTFVMESEVGIGTFMTIRVNTEYLRRKEPAEQDIPKERETAEKQEELQIQEEKGAEEL